MITYHDMVKAMREVQEELLKDKNYEAILKDFNRMFHTNMTTLDAKERTEVSVKDGTEGPASDPYSFTEFYAEVDGKELTLHTGLAEWLQIKEGNISQTLSGYDHRYEYNRFDGMQWDEWENGMTIEMIFETLTGRNLSEVYREQADDMDDYADHMNSMMGDCRP